MSNDTRRARRTPRWAPAREDGLKPWVVRVSSFGSSNEAIYWARSRPAAEYQAKGRQMHTYATARRATPADVERLGGGS